MAKKETSEHPKLPFSVGDRAAFIRKATVALEVVSVPTVRMVTYSIAYNRVETIDLPLSRISVDPLTREQFYVDGDHISGGPSAMARTHLSWLRSRALESGATPDAIRLLSKATSAFTKKEEQVMGEKLQAKKPAKADKEGLKSAAKTAPVAKSETPEQPKRRGNPEALAKARAARASGPDTRKIKALVKPKDLKLREGSWTRHMVETMLAHKDAESAKNAHKASGLHPNKNLDFTWAKSKGYIDIA